ncbi:helix-turn-helix domain-containing protein [Microcoleus sp. Pol10D4]|uniref:helix-turn-helix domain-containing protein n=1 Tax=Microcoleus sp. Pol10D4 TaxID=3055387 RepID=UPI002FCF2E37
MGARLRVFLNQEEDRTLFELRAATTVPQKVKDRAQIIRLNSQGCYVEEIAAHFNCREQTVREVIHRWVKMGLTGLWSTRGRGVKPKWKESDIVHLEECLRNEPRRYNSRQLAQKLEQERGVKLSPDRLRRILKKKRLFGNEPDQAIKTSKTHYNAQ